VRIYLDSSALLKRVIEEPDSAALVSVLDRWHADGELFVCSSLGWVEVARGLRARVLDLAEDAVAGNCETALSGVHDRPITADVVALARRLRPRVLRSLDAIHVASALLTDVDLVVAYDERLRHAATENGLRTSAPAELVAEDAADELTGTDASAQAIQPTPPRPATRG
jgi:predicted nucleic acid-binding protein